MMDMSKLKRLMIRPNGVDWKKSMELWITASTSRAWSRLRAEFPAIWAEGVAINAKIMHKPDSAQ